MRRWARPWPRLMELTPPLSQMPSTGRLRPAPAAGAAVEVEWVGCNRLRLRHDARARVFKAEQKVAGVRIEYLAPSRDGA
jgi:hypothetical protein